MTASQPEVTLYLISISVSPPNRGTIAANCYVVCKLNYISVCKLTAASSLAANCKLNSISSDFRVKLSYILKRGGIAPYLKELGTPAPQYLCHSPIQMLSPAVVTPPPTILVIALRFLALFLLRSHAIAVLWHVFSASFRAGKNFL